MTEPNSKPISVPLSRRQVVKTAAVTAAAIGVGLYVPLRACADEKPVVGETLVTQLYKSLNADQRKAMCFKFDDSLRSEVDNNWQIVDKNIKTLFNKDQQDLVSQIFDSLHSPQYVKSVQKQIRQDNRKDGLGGCAVAIFGEPGTGKFEFVLSGRHVTRRCDGDSVDGAAFGGPIFYGHAAGHNNPEHPGNVYWYQAKTANAVFTALDGKQRAKALTTGSRKERGTDTVELHKADELHGIAGSELSDDQKKLVRKTLSDLLAPFRKKDVAESLKLIDDGGGIDALHMAFYKDKDLGKDQVWDVWQIESPNMMWYFRGKPHVHTWVNIKAPPAPGSK